jgi:hypothetical protein
MVQGFYVNTDMAMADQEDYLSRAIGMKADLFDHMTEGNKTPFYPFLLTFLYSPGMSMESYFRRGKIFNVLLSVLLLFILYAIFRGFLHDTEAKILLLIAAFTVFMPRAGYIQSELLFYFLTFVAFLLFWGCLQKPGWLKAGGAGGVAGLGYLTKASLLPGVLWFVACYILVGIVVPMGRSLAAGMKKKVTVRQPSIVLNMLYLLCFVAIFLLTVKPYIEVNKRIFNQYFYNVNSTFYVWYDSWDEVVTGTRAHGDRAGWPTMPLEDIPSAGKYWQEHTIPQILGRLVQGLVITTTNALGGFGYAQYFCIYLVICILAIIKQRERIHDYLKRDSNYIIVLSIISYFMFYYMLYVFGAVIFKGPRHPLGQYLPAMFVMFYLLSKLGYSHYSRKLGCQFNLREVHIVVFCLLMLDLIFNMPYKLYKVFGGW